LLEEGPPSTEIFLEDILEEAASTKHAAPPRAAIAPPPRHDVDARELDTREQPISSEIFDLPSEADVLAEDLDGELDALISSPPTHPSPPSFEERGTSVHPRSHSARAPEQQSSEVAVER